MDSKVVEVDISDLIKVEPTKATFTYVIGVPSLNTVKALGENVFLMCFVLDESPETVTEVNALISEIKSFDVGLSYRVVFKVVEQHWKDNEGNVIEEYLKVYTTFKENLSNNIFPWYTPAGLHRGKL